MAIYTVTYCCMDQEVGANPGWHTCIILSRYNEETKKLEVVETWGFYGLPSTSPPDSYLRRLKIMVGLDVNIDNNHGMLRHEEMRYLEVGHGLHGATFEVTEEKFVELQQKCKRMADNQNQAVVDITSGLKLHGKPKEKSRIYPHEHVSTQIFALEQEAAKEQQRSPRLKRFSLNPFSPRTCKMQAIELLTGILTDKQVERVRGWHQAVSRFSGTMEKIFLHSSGPLKQHKKANGTIVHYRDGDNPDVKLHWTLAPQEIETLSGEVRDLFKIDDEYTDEVKQLVRQLQELEWLFRNAVVSEQDFPRRDALIKLIIDRYEAFARIEPKLDKRENTWSNSMLWLLSLPRDRDEVALQAKIADAKYLVNALHYAVTDPWPEWSDNSDLAALDEESKAIETASRAEDDAILLASKLSSAEKKQLLWTLTGNGVASWIHAKLTI